MTNVSRLLTAGQSETLRQSALQPDSWNESDLSVDVVWTTGAAVTRFDWHDGEYYDELLNVDAGSVRLDRLQAGGPVLLDHIGSTRTLAGSIIPGSVRLENGFGIARIRLSDTADMTDIVSKVREGHLRTVSVSYIVHSYEHQAGAEGARDQMIATDWEPTEISLTPVPADAGAVIRKRSDNMPRTTEPTTRPERGAVYAGNQPSSQRTVTEDQILRACSRANLTRTQERQLLEAHEEDPLSEVELYRSITDVLSVSRARPSLNGILSGNHDNPETTQRDMFADVVYSRLSGKPVADRAREYAGASLTDMARALLEANGERVRWMRPAAVFDALSRSGYHVVGDFSYLLNSAGRRYLIDAYTAAPSPLKLLARKRDFTDFRMRYGLQAEGPPFLRNVPEAAEFKRVTFATAENGSQLGTYGEIFSITRQALVNDDLGVFAQMAAFWARAQAATEASFLTALIAGNGVVMGEDNNTLYHATHGNLLTAAAPSLASLSAARLAMRQMKNRDGSTPADIVPKYLVAGPALETACEQLLAQTNPVQTDDVNPFSGRLELVIDARLTGNSWRLFADPAISPVLEYGNLEGQDGLYTESRMGFEVDGVDFKARTDIGAGAIDWRGTVMNPGS